MPRLLDIVGEKFNLLTVLKRSDQQINGNVKWDCVCDCGGYTSVTGSRLKSGITRSCGCLAKANAKGHSNPTHGMSRTSEYRCWIDARARCNNTEHPQYDYYGGRGIKMQPSWDSDFSEFLKHIGLKPTLDLSLDRLDNDSDYCEGNVRWATKLEQVTNRGKNINNTTGVTGVHLATNSDYGYLHFKAVWGPKDNLSCKSFSVNKYGYDRAFAMAVAARTEGLEKLKIESVYTTKHGEDRLHK